MKQSFPQPEKRVANWLVSALGALYNSTLGITPKMVADRYFKLCSLGRPTYKYDFIFYFCFVPFLRMGRVIGY